MLFVRNRNTLVDLLIILFGISSWISINGLWVELPLMVNVLPENWNLPSYLVVIVQLANVGPILYSILRWKMNVNNSYSIYFVLTIGVLASFIMIYIWDKTVNILGVAHSLGLFIPIFLLSLVDCTSSVLYFPYIGTFKSIYLNSFLMGEGLSGFIPSIIALLQGIGQTKCEKLYNETTQEWVTSIVTEAPNFSVEIFFFFLFGMMLISLASFMALDLSPFARSEKLSESEVSSIIQNSESYENHGTLPQSPPIEIVERSYNNKEIFFLTRNSRIYQFLFKWCSAFNSIILVLALCCIFSPSTMFDPSISGPLVVMFWILNGLSFSFSKIEIAGICRDIENSKYLFWYGALTQIGSALGALISFLMVNVFQVFTAAESLVC
ncbi:SLC52A3 [Lepeophtheirus salmonis]|uniref:Riboflavin transporter n=1 Tax=Lepeophtheirus salmonis TaxID=72036 RepID=A0A7R8H9E6_LEPSM|nr:SLC52A3 [Lepeophtheirus salmonis]CAF2948004.1 SLC52A3 [Lepeophtheirus salmonis]